MKKILKRGLIIIGLAAVGYEGYHIFKKIKALSAMEKPLKEYLTSKFGEEPKLSGSLIASFMKNVSVVAKFSAETLAMYPEIAESIRNYIEDNYPVLSLKHLKVTVHDKSMSKLDDIKEQHPKIYKHFGKLIDKKLHADEEHEDTESATQNMYSQSSNM